MIKWVLPAAFMFVGFAIGVPTGAAIKPASAPAAVEGSFAWPITPGIVKEVLVEAGAAGFVIRTPPLDAKWRGVTMRVIAEAGATNEEVVIEACRIVREVNLRGRYWRKIQ